MLNTRLCIALLTVCLFGCNAYRVKNGDSGIEKMELEGLQNVYRLSPRILTGASPEGDRGFSELQKLGVKTIVSVPEDSPDEVTAKKYGLM